MVRLFMLVLALIVASMASASIAVFTDGRSMKVASFKADDDTMKLTMANGGSIIVPLARVDRIIDDEIATPEVVAEVKKIVEEGGVFPHRSWRYNATSGPIFKTKYDKIIIEAARKFDVDAYNAGEGNIWKYNGVPPFRETVTYINRIAKHIRKAIDTKLIAGMRAGEAPTLH